MFQRQVCWTNPWWWNEEIKILNCKCFRFGCRWICLKWVALKLQANAFTPSPSLWYLVNVNYIWKVFAIIIFSGNIRRFRRICEHIQSMVCAARRAPPASPRAQRRSQKGTEMSESSSCGSDTSERINERLAPHRQVSDTCLPRVCHVIHIHVFLPVSCNLDVIFLIPWNNFYQWWTVNIML